ncbi:prenyltransferase/squalene oxidase repeat-containing protein [Oceanobacillus bengalensis]|nr:LPXTG cell wall anchor domain-containing protein [Oceanobacillus bengalensis]
MRKAIFQQFAVILSMLVVLSNLSFLHPQVSYAEESENYIGQVTSAIENVSAYIIENGVNGEWEAIGLAQAGKEVPEDYLDVFHQNVQDQVIDALENGRIKITDTERLAMAAVALKLDPRDINGVNLIEMIYNSPDRRGGYDTMTFQGNNGPIFALIALDTKMYDVPSDARWNRQGLIDELLRTQNDNGSWALNEAFGTPSVDITGMALIALSPYRDQPKVREALDKTVEWLSSVQTEEGGFDGGSFVGGITSEAASQVIIGLSAYGIDAAGEQFTKNGNSLIDHLLEFQNADGGFKHTMDYDFSNGMATEQALQALVAYDFFLKGKGNVYQFGSEQSEENPDEVETPGNGEENPDEGETPGNGEENPDEGETPGNGEENPDEGETPGNGEENPDEVETPGNGEENPDEVETPGNGGENPDEVETPGNGEENPDEVETPGNGGENPDEVEIPGNGEENLDEKEINQDGTVANNDKNQSSLEKNKHNKIDNGMETSMQTENGGQLPDTSTNTFNYIFIGLMAVLLGGFLWLFRKKINMKDI